MKSFIFYNPDHRKTDQTKIKALARALEKEQIAYAFITEKEQLLSLNKSLIWIFGGDGTLHHVLNVADTTANVFVFMGGGSGNDCLKNFEPVDVHKLLENYKTEKYSQIDLWQCNGVKFVNAGSVGFSAKVAQAANQGIVSAGFLKYALPVLRYLFFYNSEHYQIRINEQQQKDIALFLAAFGNGAFVGGGFNLFPGALMNDAMLDFLNIRNPSMAHRILYVLKVKNGKHKTLKICESAEIFKLLIRKTNYTEILYELDGETYHAKELRIEREKSGLKVLNSLIG